MICFPNAKINLGLRILEKRVDGFHNLESVFYPVNLCDVLEIVEDKSQKNKSGVVLTNSGIKIPGDPFSNICIKAYYLIKNDYPLPFIKVHLHKIIPLGAGLGGGSADAAFFIKLLNDVLDIDISWGEMHHYARKLGSDCSFFVSNRPAFVEGRGDKYESIQLDLSNYQLLLVYPNVGVSTPEAFAGLKLKKSSSTLEKDILESPVNRWKKFIHNDFEDSIFEKYPQIKKIKDKIYSLGAVYASMSGSGSSVYGIFENKVELKSEFKDFFTWQGQL